MKITYDKIADAVYIKIKDTKVKLTKKVSARMVIDLDSKGDVVGIEVLDTSSQQGVVQSLEKNVREGLPVEIISTSLLAV